MQYSIHHRRRLRPVTAERIITPPNPEPPIAARDDEPLVIREIVRTSACHDPR